VRNGGAYDARFTIKYSFERVRFTKESGIFGLGENKVIEIPFGATDLSLDIEQEIQENVCATIVTKRFDQPVKLCYKIYGNAIAPKYEEIAC